MREISSKIIMSLFSAPTQDPINPAFLSAASSPRFRLSIRAIVWIESLLLACLLTLVRPATAAAASAGSAEGAPASQISLRQGMGWEDWNAVRDQHSPRARVKVFVPKGEAPDAAKVRVVLVQTPKPSFGSPQAVLDAEVASAKRQCKKVSARTLRKGDADLIYELRGFGCPGQKGERYLLTRIVFIREWQLEATYAPMTPTDDLPASEKQQAIKLLSSATIVPG
jgi:hypothetical protein